MPNGDRRRWRAERWSDAFSPPLTSPVTSGDHACVFCEIIAGRAPASFVHEDELVVAFMDTQPVNPGHVLVVTRRHAESLDELDEQLAARLFNIAVRVQRAIRGSGGRVEGINLYLADGAPAGQEVRHAHLHVVPRYAGDSFRITCDWPAPCPRDELDGIAAAIRARAASPSERS